MDHNFDWVITIRKDIQKICWRDEEESWIGQLLLEHEFIKSFLTNGQIILNFFKSIEQIVLNTEVKSFLFLVAVSQDISYFFVDINEFH